MRLLNNVLTTFKYRMIHWFSNINDNEHPDELNVRNI